MKNNEAICATKLVKELTTNGQWIHSCKNDGFLTLYIANVTVPDNCVDDLNNRNLYLWVGYRENPTILPLKEGKVLEKFPVYKWEEVWITSSIVNNHTIFGFVESSD